MFKRVLVPLDRSPLAEQALDIAGEIAQGAHAAMDLVLVHHRASFLGIHGDDEIDLERRRAQGWYLDSIANEVAGTQNVSLTRAVLCGRPVDMICARARDVEADLIVMTSHGRTGFSRFWLGSVADGVARESKIPVLMLRPMHGKSRGNVRRLLKRIVVPVDGSPFSLSILETAADLARSINARVTLLRVVQPVQSVAALPTTEMPYPVMVDDPAATAAAVAEANVELDEPRHELVHLGCPYVESEVVVAANVAQEVMHFAKTRGADVIALSTHGRGASRLVVGTVADKVIRGSGLPVLLRRPAAVRVATRPGGGEAHAQFEPALSGL